MPEYRVVWEMDVEANSPQEAAREARRHQLNPQAIVGAFDVMKRGAEGETCVHIDLDEPENSELARIDPPGLGPEHYCRRCDLWRPCLCDERRDPTLDASKSNPGVIKPRTERTNA